MRRHRCRWPSPSCVTVIITTLVIVCVATVTLQWRLSSPLDSRRATGADERGLRHIDGGEGDASGDRGTRGTNVEQRRRSQQRRTSTGDDHIQRTGVLLFITNLRI